MVFSLEHDIKVTKNHQNLLPTQSVLVAHTVYYLWLLSLMVCYILYCVSYVYLNHIFQPGTYTAIRNHDRHFKELT
jgi:hypothetical protein